VTDAPNILHNWNAYEYKFYSLIQIAHSYNNVISHADIFEHNSIYVLMSLLFNYFNGFFFNYFSSSFQNTDVLPYIATLNTNPILNSAASLTYLSSKHRSTHLSLMNDSD
jgi:hypothetical protein